MSNMFKISVVIPDDLKEQLEKLKKEKYYNLSYSELYRQAISAGLEAIKKDKKTINENKV